MLLLLQLTLQAQNCYGQIDHFLYTVICKIWKLDLKGMKSYATIWWYIRGCHSNQMQQYLWALNTFLHMHPCWSTHITHAIIMIMCPIQICDAGLTEMSPEPVSVFGDITNNLVCCHRNWSEDSHIAQEWCMHRTVTTKYGYISSATKLLWAEWSFGWFIHRLTLETGQWLL